MTVQEVVDQARDHSPLFTRQAIPDVTAVRALSRLEKALADAVTQEAPDAFAEWYELEALPEDWEEGIILPPFTSVLGVEIRYGDTPTPTRWYVDLLSAAQSQTQPHRFPSVYVMNGRVFLTDVRAWFGGRHGWEDMLGMRFRIVPQMGVLQSLTERIRLPETAESALVSNLALWMADRVGAKLPTLRETAAGAAQGWATSIIAGMGRNTWLVEVVD
jgi:hypothetical protein